MDKTDKIIKEAIDKVIKEADRHRPGYWAERWQKQKEAKKASGGSTEKKPAKKASKSKDRHRPGYYHDYNAAHPERLNRGFTKGYKNGNISDGPIVSGKKSSRRTFSIGPFDGYYYDEFGWLRNVDSLTDALLHKEQEWHDDDWYESCYED